MVGFVVQDHAGVSPRLYALIEILYLNLLCRRLFAENRRHGVGFGIVLFIVFVKLVYIRDVERSCGGGAFAIAANVAVEIPEGLKRRGYHRVGAKDTPSLEVVGEALKHDDIGRDKQEGLRVVGIAFGYRVHILPNDSESHHLRFAASRRHFKAVAREEVVLQEAQVVALCERLKQFFLTAHLHNLIEVDKRLYGVSLAVVIAEGSAVTPMVSAEPPVEKRSRRARRALVPLFAPLRNRLP